jgi:VCBS repeat-containing protein
MSLPPHSEDGGATLVVAHEDLPDSPMTLDEQCEKLAAAHKLISTKYDTGVAFFTKDNFRDIVQQLESGGNLDHKVSVTGLDGAPVYFQINTGKEHRDHPFGNDYVCIM